MWENFPTVKLVNEQANNLRVQWEILPVIFSEGLR